MPRAPLAGMPTSSRPPDYSIFIPALAVIECTTIVVGFIMMMVVLMMR